MLKKYILILLTIFISSCETNQNTIQAKKAKVYTEVAIMLPLSGKDSKQATKLLRLIKQGLQDGAKSNIKPIIYDCTTNNMSVAAINDIVKNHVKIIIGPLFSPTTALIAETAKKNSITVITLSNNPALADKNVYVFGHAPTKQMSRIINYHLNKQYENFFTLLPNGEHSQNVASLIQNMANNKGSSLIKAEFYQPDMKSIQRAVRNIRDAVDVLNEDSSFKKKPVIYIGDHQDNLKILYDYFYEYNLDNKAEIIGDNRLNFHFSKPINLNYTGSINIEISKEKSKLERLTGGEKLNYLEGLSYDLGLIVASAIGYKYQKDKFIEQLNDSDGYMGITGIVRFNKRLAERKYDIIKKVGDKYYMLDYAEEKF